LHDLQIAEASTNTLLQHAGNAAICSCGYKGYAPAAAAAQSLLLLLQILLLQQQMCCSCS
jgi:hypothetical protein